MNRKWLKQHWPTLVAAGVFVALLAVIIYAEQKARVAIRQTEAELESQQRELDELRRKEPFPSRENLEAIKRDYEQIRQLHDALFASLTQAAVPAAELRPIEFSQQLAQKLSRLRQQAIQARVGIPEGFAFGFSRYVAALPCSRLPEKECATIVRQLSKQLAIVEWLAQLLINAPVDEIRAVRRAEVEPGVVSPDAFAPRSPSEAESLYQALPFELEFTCDEPTLRKVLNELARAQWFFTIRRLSTSAGGESGAQPRDRLGTPSTSHSAAAQSRLTVSLLLELVEVQPPANPPTERSQ